MYSNSLFPSIHWPTRISEKSAILIDNIFVNTPSMLRSGLILTDISDHLPVFCILNSDLNINTIHNKSNIFRCRRAFTSNNVNNFANSLQNCEWDFDKNADVDVEYDKFFNCFKCKFDSAFKKVTKKDQFKTPWMTTALLISSKIKNKLYVDAVSGKIAHEVYKNYRNKFNKLVVLRKNQYYNDFISAHRKNAKSMWVLLNSHFGKNTNKTMKLCDISPDDLNDFFVELGPKTKQTIKSVNHFSKYLFNRVTNSMFILPVTPEEIINVTNCLPAKLSYGYDEIPMKVIKSVVAHIAVPLTYIFNKSFVQGSVPKALKIAKICPVFKSGSSDDKKNYRPISLLPSFSKILEKLMCNRLFSFLMHNNSINQSQHGFMPNRSTSTAVADLLNTVTTALDKKLTALVLFIDISKAFDSLDHDILLAKLEHYGIRGIALTWFLSYLTSRYQYTEVDGNCSMCKLILCGVPQGSILGPLLYNIYVNDISFVATNAKCVLYADDTAIAVSENNLNLLIQNACAVFSLYSIWFADNLLALNASKTNYVVFGASNIQKQFPNNILFHTHNVTKTNTVRYLGLYIDSTLCWKDHCCHINDKLVKGIALLKTCYNVLPISCLLTMYYSYLYPYLSYCVEFWGCAHNIYLHPIMIAQKHSIRLIANVSRFAHCASIAREYEILLFNDLYQFVILNTMFKVFKGECCNALLCLFTKSNTIHFASTRSNSLNFFVQHCNTELCRKFLSHKGVMLWNALPVNLKSCTNIVMFKKLLKSRFLSQYS